MADEEGEVVDGRVFVELLERPDRPEKCEDVLVLLGENLEILA